MEGKCMWEGAEGERMFIGCLFWSIMLSYALFCFFSLQLSNLTYSTYTSSLCNTRTVQWYNMADITKQMGNIEHIYASIQSSVIDKPSPAVFLRVIGKFSCLLQLIIFGSQFEWEWRFGVFIRGLVFCPNFNFNWLSLNTRMTFIHSFFLLLLSVIHQWIVRFSQHYYVFHPFMLKVWYKNRCINHQHSEGRNPFNGNTSAWFTVSHYEWEEWNVWLWITIYTRESQSGHSSPRLCIATLLTPIPLLSTYCMLSAWHLIYALIVWCTSWHLNST